MAMVYLAADSKHGRKVALKVLLPEVAASLGAERFLREIRIAAGLVHPNVLPLHDSGEADGLLYHVTPYVEGETLRDKLSRERQLPVDETVRIVREVADALDYAHGEGVVHRDVKPENILLSKGHALIVDFGVARAIGLVGGERLTETGIVVGTPSYMSPEQARGEQIDGRADQYALACVAYEMLGGEPPLSGRTPQVILARRLSESPGSLRVLRETVSPAMDEVVRKALSRIPADRFATAGDFGKAMAAAEAGAVVLTSHDSISVPGLSDSGDPVRSTSRDADRARGSVKLSLWEELKARRVYNVGLVYLATAWVVIEASDVILADFGRPEWHLFVTVVAIAGFPIALVLAWLFEITGSGIRRTAVMDLRETKGRRLAKMPLVSKRALAAVVVLLSLFGLWFVIRRLMQGAG
jgi:serine/threonine protein kinase